MPPPPAVQKFDTSNDQKRPGKPISQVFCLINFGRTKANREIYPRNGKLHR